MKVTRHWNGFLPILGDIQDQAGWDPGQPSLVEGVHAHSGGREGGREQDRTWFYHGLGSVSFMAGLSDLRSFSIISDSKIL